MGSKKQCKECGEAVVANQNHYCPKLGTYVEHDDTSILVPLLVYAALEPLYTPDPSPSYELPSIDPPTPDLSGDGGTFGGGGASGDY